MNRTIGFIGCGNMGKAMAGALVKDEKYGKESLIVSALSEATRQEVKEKWQVRTTDNNKEIAQAADIIVLAVSPKVYETVIQEIKEYINLDKIIVTIAAGIEMKQMESWFGKEVKIVKTMPNTPVLTNAGISAISPNKHIHKEDLDEVCSIFACFGEYELLDEKDFHAFIALCGSSPAYVFMMIEAMGDAGVKLGLSRKQAYKMAEQAILGSAKLALETGEHPAALKDMVCSPGGTTIEAVTVLEKQGFRQSLITAMEACADKSIKMEQRNR